MMRLIKIIGFGTALVALALTIGCGNKPAAKAKSNAQAEKKADHGHGAGPHGGVLIEWGEEEYHPEFTVDRGMQQAVVYILGGDAKTTTAIDADKILLSVREPSFQLDLTPSPQSDDPKGKSSRFVGKHANFSKDQVFAGTISGLVGGKPYAGDFKQREAHQAGTEASQGEASARERKVFLSPGGIYTKADIEKNGSMIPSVKFKGVFWAHDDNVKSGDKVCPVTDVKADAQCSWWVNNQQYQFCCPSCLEKFVKWAKETPERVKTPETYVKK